ncbi:hypothetical protein CISG_06858 [Coccidioides immitis RMSCC 3703]|uniref:Uncharacterized protein n=1 Tax=Coccidioides immitis RMSCC 3703 TaxID=454286 RepID=A0A0J8R2M8_COCIT|nr:hypothetical protein CISG_06858 [Coccidioides immitis RMSCC 3703]
MRWADKRCPIAHWQKAGLRNPRYRSIGRCIVGGAVRRNSPIRQFGKAFHPGHLRRYAHLWNHGDVQQVAEAVGYASVKSIHHHQIEVGNGLCVGLAYAVLYTISHVSGLPTEFVLGNKVINMLSKHPAHHGSRYASTEFARECIVWSGQYNISNRYPVLHDSQHSVDVPDVGFRRKRVQKPRSTHLTKALVAAKRRGITLGSFEGLIAHDDANDIYNGQSFKEKVKPCPRDRGS